MKSISYFKYKPESATNTRIKNVLIAKHKYDSKVPGYGQGKSLVLGIDTDPSVIDRLIIHLVLNGFITEKLKQNDKGFWTEYYSIDEVLSSKELLKDNKKIILPIMKDIVDELAIDNTQNNDLELAKSILKSFKIK